METSQLIEHSSSMALPVALIIALFAICLFWVYKRSQKPVKIVLRNDYDLLSKKSYDEAYKEAKRQGMERRFLKLVTMIQRKYGKENMKVGHLFWIFRQLEDELNTIIISDIPSFEKSNDLAA